MQYRRSDHFTKLPYTKCFLRIFVSHAAVILHEKFHEYPIFKGGNFEQFQESMTKLHENFVNLFGLGSLNNICLSLFHSTLAPVAGKRSNREKLESQRPEVQSDAENPGLNPPLEMCFQMSVAITRTVKLVLVNLITE